MNDDFQYTEQDLENIAKYGCSGRFDFPFVIHLTEKYDVNFAELYGVLPGESDFSGAIERSLKNKKLDLTNFVRKLNNING